MPIPESFLEELSNRVQAEELVSSYVTLRRHGRNLVGLCPFHGEKTPSFTVYPDNNSFYCFGCGAGGSMINFIMKIEHLSFSDAVRFLADRYGLAMPVQDEEDVSGKLRRRIMEANREAARLFHRWLYEPVGREGLEYYRSRGYGDRIIRRFGLGYAPDSFHMLHDALAAKGFRDEELVTGWLCRQKNGVYDAFRHRVMVPIIDVRGNVIAFGGRVLDDSKPKYLNSGDTPVFQKTHNLFALNFAKETGRRLILCEGYMDVIALHQAGFSEAVAALGTSFTMDHAALAARYADEVFVVFDADSAGKKGAVRAMELLRRTGVRVRVVTVPQGKDPDEYLRTHAPDQFKLLLQRAEGDVEYRFAQLRAAHLTDTPDGRVAYLREAAKVIADLPGAVERDVYAGKLSEETGVSKSAILEQANGFARKREQKQQRTFLPRTVREEENRTAAVNPQALQNPRAASAEKALLGMLLRDPASIDDAAKQLSPQDMVTPFHERLYRMLTERRAQGLLTDLSVLAAYYTENEMAYIVRLQQSAEGLALSKEDLSRYIEIIRREKALSRIKNSNRTSNEEILAAMEEMRDLKMGKDEKNGRKS